MTKDEYLKLKASVKRIIRNKLVEFEQHAKKLRIMYKTAQRGGYYNQVSFIAFERLAISDTLSEFYEFIKLMKRRDLTEMELNLLQQRISIYWKNHLSIRTAMRQYIKERSLCGNAMAERRIIKLGELGKVNLIKIGDVYYDVLYFDPEDNSYHLRPTTGEEDDVHAPASFLSTLRGVEYLTIV